MKRNKLYLFLSVACLAGYAWLILNFSQGGGGTDIGVCLFKRVTSIPCPSCGSTRAVLALMHGNVLASIELNPIGLILFTLLLVTPVWLAYDLLTGKGTLYSFYQKAESMLKQRRVAIPAILLVVANWAWNIHKGL